MGEPHRHKGWWGLVDLEGSTTSAAATVSTATATTAAFALRFIYAQRTTLKVLTVQGFNGFFSTVFQFNKTEAARATGFAI